MAQQQQQEDDVTLLPHDDPSVQIHEPIGARRLDDEDGKLGRSWNLALNVYGAGPTVLVVAQTGLQIRHRRTRLSYHVYT